MNIISGVIFGIAIGIVAKVLAPDRESWGWTNAIFLGIVGAVSGVLVAEFLFGTITEDFNLAAFLTSAVGAMVLLFFGRKLMKI